MSSIFPLREKVTLDRGREPRLVELDEEVADEVFEALSSRTTRKIFLALHDQPQTASDLADVTDTSVQNVQYHLEKLTGANLVEVVDTWYSERGSEMKVYAPEDESLVLFAGRDKQSTFRKLFDRFVGIFALLLPPSILVGWLTHQMTPGGSDLEPVAVDDDTDDVGVSVDEDEMEDAPAEEDALHAEAEDAPDETPEDQVDAEDTADATETPVPEETPVEEADDAATPTPEMEVDSTFTDGNFTAEPTPDVAAESAEAAVEIAGLDPGIAAALLFFFGGLFVFAVLSYWSSW